jgi:hypothetical protein
MVGAQSMRDEVKDLKTAWHLVCCQIPKTAIPVADGLRPRAGRGRCWRLSAGKPYPVFGFQESALCFFPARNTQLRFSR